MTKISANELLKLIDNQWASTSDIMKIGSVGRNKALTIKSKIKTELENKGYYLPNNLVTMQSVLDYFKIDINYLKKVCNTTKVINDKASKIS